MNFYSAYHISKKWALGFRLGKSGPVAVFLDKTYSFDDVCGIKCQITSGSYYADTLKGHKGPKLCLDCGVPAWTIDDDTTMHYVRILCEREYQHWHEMSALQNNLESIYG